MREEANTTVCTHCGSRNLLHDSENGETVCFNCGLVIDESPIDRGPERRAFTADEKDARSRTGLGASYSLYDKGLSTMFKGDWDAKGNRLKDETQMKMSRLRRYDNRSKLDETMRRNLSVAMAELDRMSAAFHLPQNVKESAALIYRQALKKDLIRGRSIEAFVAASIYAACRRFKVPRPLREISQVSTRDKGDVSRTYRLLLKELKMKMPLDDPMKFVPSIASKLKVRRDTEQRAVDILSIAKQVQGLSGKDPRGLAAAALYMACLGMDDRRIQKDIARAAGTTEVTLRNRLRGLEETLREADRLQEQAVVVSR